MQQLLDERRPPDRDPALISHAQGCAECRSQFDTLARLLDSLELLETPQLPDDFAQRVVSSVHRERTRRSVSTTLLVAISIAATLLLVIVPTSWYLARRDQAVAQPSQQKSLLPELPSFEPIGEGWLVSSAILDLYPEEIRQRHRQQVNRIANDLRPIATPFNAAMMAIRRTLPMGMNNHKGEPRASVRRNLRSHGIS
jgi:hypothetical protein